MKHVIHLIALTQIVLLAGCGNEPATTRIDGPRPSAARATKGLGPDVEKDLATLRQITAAFHDSATAASAGWNAQITPCMTSGQGSMGYHFGNPALIGDGTVRVDQPELLLYEPEKNGQMRLVAVEYILPGAPTDQPPSLFGREFTYNSAFGVWGLHAWVWKENPSGMFADWNPDVTCAYAAQTLTM